MNNLNIQLSDIRVVILIGPLDFGRCKLASSIPPALWPMIDKPAIENVINQLIQQGFDKITVCSKVDSQPLHESINKFKHKNIDLILDHLPAGTAGSIRDAAKNKPENLFFILPAGMAIVPDIKELITQHKNLSSDLSIMFHKPYNPENKLSRSADIFICEKQVLDYIPPAGYFDIKEHLIPQLVKDDRNIHPIQLKSHTGSFRNVPAYLASMSKFLSSDQLKKQYPNLKKSDQFNDKVLIGNNCRIHDSVKIHGPVVIFDNVEIEQNTCITGPTVIGPQSWIGKNCMISDTFLWHSCGIWANSKLQNTVSSYQTEIPGSAAFQNTCITPRKTVTKPDNISNENLFQKLKNNFYKKISLASLAFAVIFTALIVSYFPTIKELTRIWMISDEYSAGMLVPFLAAYVLWTRRDDLANYDFKPSLWGIAALLLSQLIRMAGLYLNMASLERISLISTIGAIVWLILGTKLTVKLLPLLMFMLLSVPLPNQFNQFFSLKLQEWATTSAVWTLEMMGFLVKRDGNIIHLGDTTVAVAEACNGLRMIMAFFIIAAWFALLANRKFWEKIIIFLSALPISILCNTIRLAITAIAFTMINADKWAEIFHDYGGYAMMPLAIGIIIGELWILKNIFISEDYKKVDNTPKEAVIIRKTK